MKTVFLSSVIKAYLKSKIKIAALLLTFILLFASIFFLYDISPEPLFLGGMIFLIICFFCFLYDFNKFYKHFSALKSAEASIGFTIEDLPHAADDTQLIYENMIRKLYEKHNDTITKTSLAKTHLSDYYAMWVHQIKVPISAMHMLLQDQPKSSPMNVELFKIEQYVEMALSYIRLESNSTDYLFKEYSLDHIVKQAVRKYAPLFISKNITLDIADTDIKVNTDEKWLGFVIEQILSNSLKYTKSGKISIYYENPETLIIEDTGIGIAAEDIPRLGEKGFTGYNGRLYKKSTGLGLYLCKDILSRLSHTMTITSKVDKGTKVSMDLSTRHMMME